MRILAIETSCDETAIAIADFGRVPTTVGTRVRVLSHIVSSQAKLHARFGGVVPNLARREHETNLVPILAAALRQVPRRSAKIHPRSNRGPNSKQIPIPDPIGDKLQKITDALAREPELLRQFKKSIIPLAIPDIDAIAVTYGPGLAPALWTGVNLARALALLWKKPLIPTNHMAGHFFSALLQKRGKSKFQSPIQSGTSSKFPILALLVSGGHTELVLVKKPRQFKIIGETQDDAVGEAFDKVARILGLPYPGGPEIARLALKGNSRAYALPRPMMHTKDYDFSFSGLKTAVFYLIRDLTQTKFGSETKRDIAASFQAAAIEVLVKKTVRAAKEYKIKTLALGGGVAANAALRAALAAALKKELPSLKFQVPSSDLCGDNALMIAAAAYFCGKKKSPKQARLLRADANARLGDKMS